MPQQNRFGFLRRAQIHGKDFIDNSQQGIEGRLDGVAPIDRGVSMQNFLKHFGIGHEALAVANEPFE